MTQEKIYIYKYKITFLMDFCFCWNSYFTILCKLKILPTAETKKPKLSFAAQMLKRRSCTLQCVLPLALHSASYLWRYPWRSTRGKQGGKGIELLEAEKYRRCYSVEDRYWGGFIGEGGSLPVMNLIGDYPAKRYVEQYSYR